MLNLGKSLDRRCSLDGLLWQSQMAKPPYGMSAPLSQSIQRTIFNVGENKC